MDVTPQSPGRPSRTRTQRHAAISVPKENRLNRIASKRKNKEIERNGPGLRPCAKLYRPNHVLGIHGSLRDVFNEQQFQGRSENRFVSAKQAETLILLKYQNYTFNDAVAVSPNAKF